MTAIIIPAELFAARLAARQARQFSEQIRKVWEEAAEKAGITLAPDCVIEAVVLPPESA